MSISMRYYQKMKFSLNSTSTIVDLIKALLTLASDKADKAAQYASKLKFKSKNVLVSNNAYSCVAKKIEQLLPPAPAKLEIKQLEMFLQGHFDVDGKNVSTFDRTYSTDENTCSCKTWQVSRLVCSHMFAYRRYLQTFFEVLICTSKQCFFFNHVIINSCS